MSKIKLSKSQWLSIGKQAGWVKSADAYTDSMRDEDQYTDWRYDLNPEDDPGPKIIKTHLHYNVNGYGRDEFDGPSFEDEDEALRWFENNMKPGDEMSFDDYSGNFVIYYILNEESEAIFDHKQPYKK